MKSTSYFLNKCTIVFCILFYSTLVFSQEKGIILKDKKTGKVEFLRENKRIKIFTIDGTNYTGRFKIIDDLTISIDDENIPIISIIKIKRRSVVSAIIETSFYILGGIIVVASIAASTVNPMALIIIPFSFPFIGVAILIPALEDSHKLKRWEYSIGIPEPNDN